MSDNFDKMVCNGTDNCWYDNIFTIIKTLLTNYQAMLNFVKSVVKVH